MSIRSRPASREKKRYIVFRVHSLEPVPYIQLKGVLIDGLVEYLGEVGFGKASIHLIRNLWNPAKGTGYLQTNPQSVDAVKMSLLLIHQIADQRVLFQVLRVSGTIKAGRKAFTR